MLVLPWLLTTVLGSILVIMISKGKKVFHSNCMGIFLPNLGICTLESRNKW